jgi:hypothetical protein
MTQLTILNVSYILLQLATAAPNEMNPATAIIQIIGLLKVWNTVKARLWKPMFSNEYDSL